MQETYKFWTQKFQEDKPSLEYVKTFKISLLGHKKRSFYTNKN